MMFEYERNGHALQLYRYIYDGTTNHSATLLVTIMRLAIDRCNKLALHNNVTKITASSCDH
jgi:hypothetical protein